MLNSLLDYANERLHASMSSPSACCKICGGEAIPFDMVDFNKSCDPSLYPLGLGGVPVIYLRCNACQFIFTEFFDGFTEEQWRRYVYNDEYVKVDPDYVTIRPRFHAHEVSALLWGKKENTIGLDYGGGNGLTATLLRKKGWKFDAYDPFGHSEMLPDRIGRYNFCSALEVFEHTTDPVGSLRAIIEQASPNQLMIMIRTGAHDDFVSNESRLSWWYAAPRNGHVSLYSRKSLQVLGAKFGLTFSTVRGNNFLLTRGMSGRSARMLLLRGKILRRLQDEIFRG